MLGGLETTCGTPSTCVTRRCAHGSARTGRFRCPAWTSRSRRSSHTPQLEPLWYALDAWAGHLDSARFELSVAADAAPEALLAGLVQASMACAGSLDAMPPDLRGFHPFGSPDRAGFAAMACAELLVHTDDALRGLGTRLDAPRPLAAAVLARLFPWQEADTDPWQTLLWAHDRPTDLDRPAPAAGAGTPRRSTSGPASPQRHKGALTTAARCREGALTRSLSVPKCPSRHGGTGPRGGKHAAKVPLTTLTVPKAPLAASPPSRRRPSRRSPSPKCPSRHNRTSRKCGSQHRHHREAPLAAIT